MKKSFYILSAALLMGASVTLGAQGAANAADESPAGHEVASGKVSLRAWPTGCRYGQFDNGAEASCSHSNGGSYSASVICRPEDGGDFIVRDASVWKTSGRSYVFCPPLTQFNSAGINTRSTH